MDSICVGVPFGSAATQNLDELWAILGVCLNVKHVIFPWGH